MEFPVASLDYNSLFNIYSKYFVKDYAIKVREHLKGSYYIDQEYLKVFSENKINELFKEPFEQVPSDINVITKFISECVQYAISKDLANIDSLETWNYISGLPSIYHDEINALVFATAVLYLKTIDDTLMNVLFKDSQDVADSIRIALQIKTGTNTSGAHLNTFNWGLLSDGMWLNKTLLYAFDTTNAFGPGLPMVAYYYTVCYDFARSKLTYPEIEQSDIDVVEGYLDAILSQCSKTISEQYTSLSNFDLPANLRYASNLVPWIDYWEKGLTNPKILVESITLLSSLINVLTEIRKTGGTMVDDGLVPNALLMRLDHLINILSLCLIAYEAIRESTFENTLILYTTKNEDGTSEVFINSDTINAFHSIGLDDHDLVCMGIYITELSDIIPSNGYSLQWAVNRRDDIVNQVNATALERSEEAINRDKEVLRNIVIDKLTEITRSYLETKHIDTISQNITDTIGSIARNVASNNDISINDAIFNFLVMILDNSFLTGVSEYLVKYLSSDVGEDTTYALGLTVVESSMKEAMGYIYSPVSE